MGTPLRILCKHCEMIIREWSEAESSSAYEIALDARAGERGRAAAVDLLRIRYSDVKRRACSMRHEKQRG
jgi:hypothetical protein